MVFSPGSGSKSGSGPSGSSADRSRFHSCSSELDRGLPADLLAPHLVGQFLGFGVGAGQHERGGGQDEQLVRAAAVAGQAALDVGVERLAVVERGCAG